MNICLNPHRHPKENRGGPLGLLWLWSQANYIPPIYKDFNKTSGGIALLNSIAHKWTVMSGSEVPGHLRRSESRLTVFVMNSIVNHHMT